MMGEKRHFATDRRRQRARAEGKVIKSHDLTSSSLLVIAFLSLMVWGRYSSLSLMSWISGSLTSVSVVALKNDDWRDWFVEAVTQFGTLVSPLIGVMFLAVILVNLAQTGFVMSPDRIQPDLQKLSLVAGFRRLFSSESLMKLALGCLKISVGVGLALFLLHHKVQELVGLSSLTISSIGSSIFDLMTRIGIQVALVLLALGALDYLFQRWKFERDIMMTDEELREELKETEAGREVVRRRRDDLQQNLVKKQAEKLPLPELVITSAADIAVAVGFSGHPGFAVRVLKKSVGGLASEMSNGALKRGVVVTEQTTLANALHALVEEGQLVPRQLHSDLLALRKSLERIYR